MLVNRVRHPLRPIAPGAAVNPYLTHTDLSLNPANWFNRRSERMALEKSKDPLTQERILMATHESALKYEKKIKRLKEEILKAIEHYNKHVERYGAEKAVLLNDVKPAIGKAVNYYHGKGAEEKNERRRQDLEKLQDRIDNRPEALETIEISVLDGLETRIEDLDEDIEKNSLLESPSETGEGKRARFYDSMRRSESGSASEELEGDSDWETRPELLSDSGSSNSSEDETEWGRRDCE